MDELVARELAPRPSPSGSLTADLLKKGAAWLRATGYRSRDLYVSAAVRRHLATHGGTAVGLEEKEAIRICRRGRGEPRGRRSLSGRRKDSGNGPVDMAVQNGRGGLGSAGGKAVRVRRGQLSTLPQLCPVEARARPAARLARTRSAGRRGKGTVV